MFDRGGDARIRDLEKRVERQPGSRFFAPLAEEYRKAGRLPDAIRALEDGLSNHAGYVAARVALGRAYLEAGRIEDSIAAFSRAIADDPANIVAAKALADLHLSRGELEEALFRYRLCRDISGDRRLDDTIARLEASIPPPAPVDIATAVPPPAFAPSPETPAAPLLVPQLAPGSVAEPLPAAGANAGRPTDPHDISGVTWKRPSGPVPLDPESETAIPSRDLSLDELRRLRDDDDIVTRKIRLPESMWPFQPEPPPQQAEPLPEPSGPESPGPEPEPPPAPTGRTLAELYVEQGHFQDAARVYEELLAATPGDAELARLREDFLSRAEAAEAPKAAAEPPAVDLPPADPARERRLARIEVLNSWIDVMRARSGRSDPAERKDEDR